MDADTIYGALILLFIVLVVGGMAAIAGWKGHSLGNE